MNREKYLDDLKEIREIMDKSSRFISLSGLSGIVAGIIALIGAYIAYTYIYIDDAFFGYRMVLLTPETIRQLLILATLILFLALGAGIFFTKRKADKTKQKLWDQQTKRLLFNLMIPLAAGGILCLIFLVRGYVGIVAPLTLVFYGLALVNASKYTLSEIRALGLMQVALGLLAAYFVGYGLLFWAMGFGVLHIIYGVRMHLKYGS
jgi:MFS family permease